MVERRMLRETYKKFKSNYEDFLTKRCELLKGSEELLSDISSNLMLRELRSTVEELIKKELERLNILYLKIWNGEPTDEDLDCFIALALELIEYKEFIPPDQIKLFEVLIKLISAQRLL